MALAPAQYYSLIELMPPGTDDAELWKGDTNSQVGFVTVASKAQAARWEGTTGSLTMLGGPQFDYSHAFDHAPGIQVGSVYISNLSKASLWFNTAASRVDMHPPGYYSSGIYTTTGSMHAGYARPNQATPSRAAIWMDEQSPPILVHPADRYGSFILDASGTDLVGSTTLSAANTNPRAALWRQNGSEFIDLHLANYTSSQARAVYAGFQGGIAGTSDRQDAVLWNGSAETGTILTGHYFRPGAWINDISATQQVGSLRHYARSNFGGVYWDYAALWSGTPESFFNLSQFVPAGSNGADAQGIDKSTGDIVGHYSLNSRRRPVIWRKHRAGEPLIAVLSPSKLHQGHQGVTVDLYGSNFTPQSIVKFDHVQRPSTFVHSGHLQITLNAADIVYRHAVTVEDPVNGKSNWAMLTSGNQPGSVVAYQVSKGFQMGGSLNMLQKSDNQRVAVRSNLLPGNVIGTQFIFHGRKAPEATSQIHAFDVLFEMRASQNNLKFKVELFDWFFGVWRQVGSGLTNVHDTSYEFTAWDFAKDLIGLDGTCRIRVSVENPGGPSPAPITVWVDYAQVHNFKT